MLSSSWSRPARRPARGGPHALCRLSDLPSLSLLRIPLSPILPLPPFSPFSPAGFQPSLPGFPPGGTHSHFDSSSTLSLLSFPPFATTTYRSILFFFFFVFALLCFAILFRCTRVQEGKVKSKRKGERKGEEGIKYWILLLAVSYLFFFSLSLLFRPMQLCSSLSYTSFDFARWSSSSSSFDGFVSTSSLCCSPCRGGA